MVIRRSPLLVEFRDAKTGLTINADARPMGFDPKGTTVAAAKKLGLEEHFYGLGEKAARLDKRRGQFTMWNSNIPGYSEGTDPIYQSIPFYIGLQNGAAYGIFSTTATAHFDFGHVTQEFAAFSADAGEMNYYFFRAHRSKILGKYADLTGTARCHRCGRSVINRAVTAITRICWRRVVRRYREEDLPLMSSILIFTT